MPLFATYKNTTYTLSIYPETPVDIDRADVFAVTQQFGSAYTRPAVTKVLRAWKLAYSYIPEADEAILESLFNAINYTDIFAWYYYIKNVNVNVRLKEMPKVSFVGAGFYHVELSLAEV